MPIPKYNELFNDVLKELSNQKEYKTRNLKEIIANKLNLSDEERNQMLPSNKSTVIENRLTWAISYLKHAGFIESKKWGQVNITDFGLESFNKTHNITLDDLYKVPKFAEWKNNNANNKKSNNDTNQLILTETTPEEEMEISFNKINDELAEKILENILNKDSIFFERLVVDLLLKMGYGEFRPDAGKTTPPTNDGGIDGIINEDRLGLDKIAIQAKRYNKSNKIGAPLLQGFVGALMGKGVTKGVFITTSSFTNGAIDYARNQSIILIDGNKLAELMIEYDVGTFTSHIYKIKRVDSDYFNLGE